MTHIPLAILQRGSKRYTEEGRDNAGLLIGDIRIENVTKSHRAFVKICHHAGQLQAELVCSVIGRFLGLNIPQPFVVAITPESKPPIEHPLPCLALGTAAQAGMSFARLGNFEELLGQLKGLGEIAGFDQLIANVDRHLGQLIYDGTTAWAIDHAQSFGGSHWSVMGLPAADIDIINWLLERSVYGDQLAKNEIARFDLRKKTHQSFNRLPGKTGTILHGSGMQRFIDEVTLRDLYTWLETRITHSVEQICRKIGLPEMPCSSSSSASSPACPT